MKGNLFFENVACEIFLSSPDIDSFFPIKCLWRVVHQYLTQPVSAREEEEVGATQMSMQFYDVINLCGDVHHGLQGRFNLGHRVDWEYLLKIYIGRKRC